MNLSKNKSKLSDKPPKSASPLTLPPLVPPPSTAQNERNSLPSIKDLESDLLAKAGKISPDDILKLNKHTKNYLCEPKENIYQIEFVRFKIRDAESNVTLFEVAKSETQANEKTTKQENDEASRFVRYNFSPEFLKLKTVGATVEFTVGDKPVNNFRMIERHYFGDKLLKNFDFNFGFCVPNSRNTVEHIYEFPALDKNTIKSMIENPFMTKSDTFYFVDNVLIMHNKADYAYTAD